MCCGHLRGEAHQPADGSLLTRIERDLCVCCGNPIHARMMDGPLEKVYIAERVWVCQPVNKLSASCCYDGINATRAAIDHSVSHRTAILAKLNEELRERNLSGT